MLGEEPSLLQEYVDAVLRREEFKLLLQNQKDHTGVDHDGKSLFIIPLQVFFFPPVLFSLLWQKVRKFKMSMGLLQECILYFMVVNRYYYS